MISHGSSSRDGDRRTRSRQAVDCVEAGVVERMKEAIAHAG